MLMFPQIAIPSSLYIRNPEETPLGRAIVGNSVDLMHDIGFEEFTFKKLAAFMRSTEASVYRYFSNKHQLLQYLQSWYWLWLLNLLKQRTANVVDPTKRLKAAVAVLVDSGKRDNTIPHIDESRLQKLVVLEGAKAERSQMRAKNNQTLSLECYGLVCDELSALIKACKPRYKTPRTLATTLVFTAHRMLYLGRIKNHPLDIHIDEGDEKELSLFLEKMLFAVIR